MQRILPYPLVQVRLLGGGISHGVGRLFDNRAANQAWNNAGRNLKKMAIREIGHPNRNVNVILREMNQKAMKNAFLELVKKGATNEVLKNALKRGIYSVLASEIIASILGEGVAMAGDMFKEGVDNVCVE